MKITLKLEKTADVWKPSAGHDLEEIFLIKWKETVEEQSTDAHSHLLVFIHECNLEKTLNPPYPNNNKRAQKMGEKPPISDFYKLIDHVTIFKSQKWWEAIAVIESYGRRSIAMYMWQYRDGKWKRKHKFQLRNLQEWNKVKNAVDKLAPKLTPK